MVQRENDTKTLVDALDLLEEARPLSPQESTLCRLAIQGVRDIQTEKLTFWQQCFHLQIALEWDENSRFFYTAASGRKRENKIHYLESDGVEQHSHEAKSVILYDFFKSLLGTSVETKWKFGLNK
jgi:hypothetical protein